jgi:hypothetical protein
MAAPIGRHSSWWNLTTQQIPQRNQEGAYGEANGAFWKAEMSEF